MITSMKVKHISLLALFALFISISSCSKSEDESEPLVINAGNKISRITTLNVNTGIETTLIDFKYNAAGKVIEEATSAATFTAVYNSDGVMTKITKSPKGTGETIISELDHDISGKITKQTNTVIDAAGGRKTVVIDYEYTADGKISKLINNGGYVTEMTWSGDNLSQMRGLSAGRQTIDYKMSTYDNKEHPYYLIKDFIQVTHNTIISKNNPMNNLTTDENGISTNYSFSYQYSNLGKVISSAVSAGFGATITNFYYVP
jgi:hypothetical protein